MAGEVPLSPSQVRKNGRWRPIRHKTTPNLRSPSPTSTPPRQSSLRAALRRKPLSTINEDKAPSLRSNSTVSLRLNTGLPYQPSRWSHSSESLVCFHPSQQLQNYQSVSLHCADTWYESMLPVYTTHSEQTVPPRRSYESSDVQSPTTYRTDTSFDLDNEENLESRANRPLAEEEIPREAIADLFHRVSEYERDQPEVVRDSGKVWVRVNSVGHGLSRKLKIMGSLRKEKGFEARLGHNVPVYSQLRIYEKPSRIKRVKIALHDWWREFRNWSTGRDTELWAGNGIPQYPRHAMDASILSLTLSNPGPMRRQICRGGRAGVGQTAHRVGSAGKARRDSKMSTGGQIKRRKSSLFLDVYSSDVSTSSGSYG